MKILRTASRAGFLAILFALITKEPALAQIPAQPASASPNPVSLQNPSAAILNSTASPIQTPWYDTIFQQKLPVEFGFRLGQDYSDNIFYQPKKTSDFITTLTPILSFTLGDAIALTPQLDQETIVDKTDSAHENYFHVAWQPTLNLYASNAGLDDVDEYADAIFTHRFARLTLSLEQKYEKLSQPTVQINAQGALINRDIFTTVACANYIYSEQLSTYGTFSQTVNTYVGNTYTDNTEWLADYYFLYQLFPKLSVGFGPRIGFDDIDQQANQSFQSGLVHFAYVASGKFTLTGAAGAELREYEHDASAEVVTPIAEGVATYKPFDSMTITLSGENHRIVSGSQTGNNYTASIVDLRVRQRLFQVVYLNLSAGFENDQYTAVAGGAGGPNRDDDIYDLIAGLEWKSFRGLSIAANYQYLRDDSNFNQISFNQNRVSLSATFIY